MTNIKNKEFYQSVYHFADSSYHILNDIHERKRMIRRFKIINDGAKKQWDWVTKTDWIIIVVKHWKEIINLSEFKNLVKTIKSDRVLNRHYEVCIPLGSASITLFSSYTFQYVLAKLLEVNSKKLNQHEFDRLYLSLEKFLYSDSIPIKYLSPLTGLAAEVDQVDISDKLRIRRLTISEKEKWANFYLHKDISDVVMFTEYAVKYLSQ
jgi:hypothetical protein